MTNREFLSHLAAALASLAASALLLASLSAWLLPYFDESFAVARDKRAVEPLFMPGNHFRPRLSGGSVFEGRDVVITNLKNGEAILVNETRFDTANYQFARFEVSGLHPGLKLFLFWQTVEQPGGIFYAEVPLKPDGDGWFNLTQEGVWNGTVHKLEIGVFGDNLRHDEFRLHELSLHPYSAAGLLASVWTQWRHFKPWDQSSINAYYAGAPGSMVYPPVAAAIWLVLAALLFLMISKLVATCAPETSWFSSQQLNLRAGLMIIMSLGWLPLAGLWLAQLSLQIHESKSLFAGKSLHEKKLADWDGSLYQMAYDTRKAIGDSAERISVLYADEAGNSTALGRLRYHLLPELKAVFMGRLTSENISTAAEQAHILVLTNNAESFASAAVEDMRRVLRKDNRFSNVEIEVVFVLPRGLLLRI